MLAIIEPDSAACPKAMPPKFAAKPPSQAVQNSGYAPINERRTRFGRLQLTIRGQNTTMNYGLIGRQNSGRRRHLRRPPPRSRRFKHYPTAGACASFCRNICSPLVLPSSPSFDRTDGSTPFSNQKTTKAFWLFRRICLNFMSLRSADASSYHIS